MSRNSLSAILVSPAVKQWLNRIGVLLGIAGVVFVAIKLAGYAHEMDTAGIGLGSYIALAILAIVYGASNILLAFGWWHLLRYLNVPARRGWALRAYAVSQLAKYVPGNVFHFAGRHAIGLSAGFDNKPLAKSTAFEIFLLVAGGALFAPLAVPLLYNSAGLNISCVVAFVALALVALAFSARFGGTEFYRASIFYLAFLAISGLIFAGVYHVIGDEDAFASVMWISGAYVIAWLAGLVTPGAPAGIGVREAVLLFLLNSLASPPVILLAIVAGRAVTVLGDLGFFLARGLLRDRKAIG